MASTKKYKTAKGQRGWFKTVHQTAITRKARVPYKVRRRALGGKNTIDIATDTWVAPKMERRTVNDYKPLFFQTKAHLAEGSLNPMRRS